MNKPHVQGFPTWGICELIYSFVRYILPPKYLIGVARYPTPRPCACDAYDRALHTLHSWRKVGNWWTSTASNLTEVGRRPMNPARPARPRNLPPRQRFCLLLRFLSLDILPPGAIGVRNELPRAGLCRGCLDGQRDRLARHVLCLDEVALGLTDFRQFDPQQRVVGFDPEGALDRTGGDRVVLGGELDVRLIDEGARGRTKHGLSTGRLWQRFGRLHRRRRRAGSSFYRRLRFLRGRRRTRRFVRPWCRTGAEHGHRKHDSDPLVHHSSLVSGSR